MSSKTIIKLVKAWGDLERKEFVDFCQEAINKCEDPSLTFGEQPTDINNIIYDICKNCIQGEVSSESVVIALREIQPLQSEITSIIADVFSLLDVESQSSESNTVRERFFNLLRLCNNAIVPESILKERLEFETLGDAGIMKLLRNIQTKFIKTKTRLFYKQQKFNLFREEIEGYAKLITELDPGTEDSSVKHSLEAIQSLIGYFNLDPNRVLDVILESFEYKSNYADFFNQLLQSYFCNSKTISQVIGFKYSFYQHDDSKETPPSLFQVTAFLLKSKVMELNQLYPLLRPEDSKIIEEYKHEMTDALAYVKQLNSLSTNPNDSNKENTKDSLKIESEDNQKLGLCAALLDVGDWEHAKQLIGCFPDYYASSHSNISVKLCTLVHVLIDDFYKTLNFCPNTAKATVWKLLSGVKITGVKSYAELFADPYEMILVLGPHLHSDPVLMAKIVRLSKSWMLSKLNDPSHGISAISAVIDQSLLPSLSMLDSNCCMAEEIWSLLKLFPYQSRYTFYYNWKVTAVNTHPILLKVKADVLKKVKYIMKRLSKETIKPTGRQIGKLSHTNPGYIFDYILSQIQTWDNLIVPVIDSLKYLTSLSYDVLACCIIEALGNSDKDRMKHDGTSISVWIQSLANFGGSVFKKYPIDISGLLQHVANQLIAGKSLDLLILKEIVQKMAGIEATEEMTSEQLEAMTGGDLLRSEGGYFNQLRNVKKSSQRLKEALLDQDLAIPLCLLMAQQRNCILFHEQENSHIKLVGKLYDQCQDTLVQYGYFLANNLNMEDYANRLPLVSALLSDYFIQTDVAFFLARPSLNHIINSKLDELKKQDKSLKNISSSQSVKKYLEVVDSVFAPIVLSIRSNHMFVKAWEDLNPQFYVTFWSLSMYDLTVPSSSYAREINKLKASIQNEDNKDAGKKKKERERCDSLISKLQEEEKLQIEHNARVLARLKNEKDSWFTAKAAKAEAITQFLQLCLFPRCIFTPVDALYCAKFVHLIHCLKTPTFSTLLCYDRVFCDITNTLASCTENEANRYGLLLSSMLETVMRWHSDEAIFEKECSNFPGFVTKFKVTAQTGDPSVDHVDYENYRHVCHKWHFKITKAVLKCLDSGEFIQIRNSLLILTKVSNQFPIIQSLSIALERRIEKIKSEEKDKRPDLFVLATGYSGVLKSRKGCIIPESEFHNKDLKHNSQVKNEPTPKVEKKNGEVPMEISKEKMVKIKSENDSTKSKSNLEKLTVSQSSSSQSSTKRSSSSRNESEQNGLETARTKIVRVVEEKSSSDNVSPMRREEKTITMRNSAEKTVSQKDDKRERREDRHEKQHSGSGEREISESSRDSHHRRNQEAMDGEREHKRRRTDGTSRSPREVVERESRSLEKLSDERNGSRDKISVETKVHKESDFSAVEKPKTKEKKTSRKREHTDDSGSEPRRRRQKADKEEDSSKRVDNERESSRSRREEKSPNVYANNIERRTEREDKKHHRSSSASSSLKKRS